MPSGRQLRIASVFLLLLSVSLLGRSFTDFTVEGSAQNSNAWHVVGWGCGQDEGEAVASAEPGKPPFRGAKNRCEREGAKRAFAPLVAFSLAAAAFLGSRRAVST